jgi:hypothetical protein
MRIDLPLGLLLGAVVANAILVGASLNQSIKQLPARRRIRAGRSRAAPLPPPAAPGSTPTRPCIARRSSLLDEVNCPSGPCSPRHATRNATGEVI